MTWQRDDAIFNRQENRTCCIVHGRNEALLTAQVGIGRRVNLNLQIRRAPLAVRRIQTSARCLWVHRRRRSAHCLWRIAWRWRVVDLIRRWTRARRWLERAVQPTGRMWRERLIARRRWIIAWTWRRLVEVEFEIVGTSWRVGDCWIPSVVAWCHRTIVRWGHAAIGLKENE